MFFFLKNTGGSIEYITKIKFDENGSVETSMTPEKKEFVITDCAKVANDYQTTYPIVTEVYNASAKAVEQLSFHLNRAAYTIQLYSSDFEDGDTTSLPKAFNQLIPKLIDHTNGSGTEMQNVEWKFGGTVITSLNLGQYEISNTSITLEANKGDICITIEIIIVPLNFYGFDHTFGQKVTAEKAKLITNFDGCEYRYYTKNGQILTLTDDNKSEFTPNSYSGNKIKSFRHTTTNKVYNTSVRIVANENYTDILSTHSILEYYNWNQIRKDASNGTFTFFIPINPTNQTQYDTLFFGLDLEINSHYRIPTTYETSLCDIGVSIRTSDECVELTEAECDPRFINWSGQTLTSDSSLDSLLNGESEITDAEVGKRRNIKARLFLTNTNPAITSQSKINFIISKIAAKEKIIWIEYTNLTDSTGIWSYRGGNDLNLNVEYIEFFAIKLHDGNPAYNSGDFLDKLAEGANNNWQFLTRQMYEALDYLSKGINGYKIPSYVYDSGHTKYDSTYIKIYQYATYPIREHKSFILKSLLGFMGSDSTGTDPSATAALAARDEFAADTVAVEFGMICGVWNGALDVFSWNSRITKTGCNDF